MKVNFDTVLVDLRGSPIKDSGSEDLTLSAVCCTVLLSPYPDEQNLGGKDKVRRYKLALKVSEGGEQEVSAEDISDLKALIAKGYAPLVVGRAYEILDPSSC